MQKTKRKPKIVKSIPPLKIINFSKDDTRANTKGILTKAQKTELYRLWFKQKVGKNIAILYIFGAILGMSVSRALFPFGFIHAAIGVGFLVLLFRGIHEALKYNLVKDSKIKSFTGTARRYENDSGWYLGFDDVMTFEIKDQPNKLFKPEHQYRVFITDKDNIILSARLLDS
jgi:hypothetical protein